MKRAFPFLLLIGCGVDLPFPEDVSCLTNADCREGVCKDGQCVDSATIDVTPPRLLGISVASPQALVLTFDERLDPQTITDLQHYAATPALTFVNAAIGSEGQTVVLSVTTQTAGISYDLTTNAIADAAGNVISPPDDRGTFTGATVTADTLAPVTLAPPNGARLFGASSVTFAWTARVGARSYSVVVATDPELTTPIPGSPFTVYGPATTLQLALPDAAQYYWRVDSDIAARQGDVATFSLIGDRLYVYCPPGPSCDTSGNGTIASPFRTISQALADASLHGVPRIDVATRGDGSAYTELVILESGVNLYGGYTPSFDETARDSAVNDTLVRGPAAYTVFGENLYVPIVVDGFHFRAGSAPTTHVVQLNSVRGATLNAIVIDADPSAPDASEWIGIHITESSSGCGTRYPSCDGDDDCPLYCTTQSIAMKRPTITVPTAIDLAAGIYSVQGEIEIDGAIITVADMPRRVLGFNENGGSKSVGVRFNVQSIIRNSRIVTGEADETYAIEQDAQNFVSVGTIERNTIRAGDGTYRSVGVQIRSLTGLIFTNNDVQSGLAGFTYGAQLNIDNNFVDIVANNTIGSGPVRSLAPEAVIGQSTALDGSRAYVLANNILFSRENAGGRCVRTLNFPGRIESNLLFGCATPWLDVAGDLNDCGSYSMLNQWSADAGVCNNNEVGADLSAYFAGFNSDDMHLSTNASTAARFGGIPTSAFIYGQVTVDRDSRARTCPSPGACYSRGAYESD